MKFKFYAVKLSGIAVLTFVAQYYISNFTNLFILNQNAWAQPWRFLTSIFLHANLGHLALNLFALLLFGSILEKFIGGKRFLLVFFTTGVLANIISINFYDSSLGASGAIFGVIGALIIIRPLLTVWTFNMPMPLFVAGILWASADILGTYGFFTGNPLDNTGNIAHLSGMLFGLLFGTIYREKFLRKRKFNVSIDENVIRNWEETYMKN